MKSELIPVGDIVVLDSVERPLNKVADDRDAKSIQVNGIQQPLMMVECEGEYYLAKGLRRLRIARHLGISKVPAVVLPLPKGKELEAYVRELRMVLQIHRQDLAPSQKAELVEKLKEQFGMKHKDVAAYLGISPDSVTNWLSVRNYIPELVEEIDAGRLTSQKARVFDGMTPEGQKTLWKKHQKEILETPGGTAHKLLRSKYSPEKHPEFYRNAEVIADRMKRAPQKRQAKKRANITSDEKRRMMTSVELKTIELEDGNREIATKKARISASITGIAAITRDPDLRSMVPPSMLPELDGFAEIYC